MIRQVDKSRKCGCPLCVKELTRGAQIRIAPAAAPSVPLSVPNAVRAVRRLLLSMLCRLRCLWRLRRLRPVGTAEAKPQPAPHPAASLSFWKSGGGPAFSLSKT
jgi:hypothetical protein